MEFMYNILIRIFCLEMFQTHKLGIIYFIRTGEKENIQSQSCHFQKRLGYRKVKVRVASLFFIMSSIERV